MRFFADGAPHASRSARSRVASSVLVAVDGPRTGLDAVAWAAAEASVRQARLDILHVIRWDPFDPTAAGPGDAVHDAARRGLDRAAERARTVAPQLAIATHLHTGDPARTITIEGDHADLIVLGRDATDRPHRLGGRWVTRQVAVRSGKPVTVVGLSDLPGLGPSAGRVVAVLPADGDPATAWAVLGAAFNAAHRRDVGVTVLADDRDIIRGAGEISLDELVRQHQQVFFDVDVRRQPLTTSRGSRLCRAARSAALVVVAAPEGPLARWRSRSGVGRLLETVPASITFVHRRPSHLLGHRTSQWSGLR